MDGTGCRMQGDQRRSTRCLRCTPHGCCSSKSGAELTPQTYDCHCASSATSVWKCPTSRYRIPQTALCFLPSVESVSTGSVSLREIQEACPNPIMLYDPRHTHLVGTALCGPAWGCRKSGYSC
ncbi:hypothetical protein L227DRAFT_107062 [Lentinus tigrinus ALCF2SS1-6]|uniref:Uncharacterized protein n=1 Tax=Lentinus tigrinus ALCF2SS1-6 TaxID=1328759 RepID=A0A5C2S8Q0_9APHY|nr:hypothetical protein L227DRAFT_107062 [Lentinus tigrinus ALCF2SS1-6]